MFKLPKAEVERIKAMVPTIAELRLIDLMRDYMAVRRAYYGKTIPPVEEVLFKFLPRHELRRLVKADEDEEIDALCAFGTYRGTPTLKAIVLANDLNLEEVRLRLLHETAHMKVNIKFGRRMGEGKHWNKEMHRLMRLGAFDGWL